MKRRGIDSIESWVISIACSLSYMLYPLPMRLGGQMFVSILDSYQISRQSASLPFTVAFLVRSLAGPFAGYFGQKFGLQETTMIGSILCVIGVGGCYFAEDVITIIIFLGFFYGLGVGVATSLVPEVINQHFKKHRAKSMGVVFGGSSLGVFIFSPLLENILHNYGFSGSFLLMSGIILHSVPFTMLLKKPHMAEERTEKVTFSLKSKISIGDSLRSNIDKNNTTACESDCNLTLLSMKKEKELQEDARVITKENAFHDSKCDSKSLAEVDIQKTPDQNITKRLNSTEEFVNHIPQNQTQLCLRSTDQCIKDNIQQFHVENDDHFKIFNYNSQTESDTEFVTDITLSENAPLKICITDEISGNNYQYREREHRLSPVTVRKSHSHQCVDNDKQVEIDSNQSESASTKNSSSCSSMNVLWSPLFLIVTYIQSSHFYLTYISWTIIVDVVRDKKVDEQLEVYFVMALSLTDMIGRFALGCITDNGYMTRANFSALCFTVMGLSSLLVTLVTGFTATMLAICVLGLASGANTTALPGIVTQFFNESKRPVAMASRLILFIPMSFSMSPLIGYFRGYLGSYDGLFYFLAAMCIVTTTLLVLLPKFKCLRNK